MSSFCLSTFTYFTFSLWCCNYWFKTVSAQGEARVIGANITLGIVTIMNELRSFVQPTASNMQMLVSYFRCTV